ncbi:hypothetical protein ANO14919_075410 [Xylariales sp. No.14919]|nr:hypothetical protein ANO14919_075410 [Xylariales sp. No.14919]
MGGLEGSGQVKIKGIGVELDEIASVMIRESAGALIGAVISLRPGLMDLQLAFVVFGAEFDSNQQRNQLIQPMNMSASLAAHMRPNIIVPVEKLPTNLNGKFDRAAIYKLQIPSL